MTDRDTNAIKSDGEWISSIEIINLAVGYPQIIDAAIIGIAHPKWGERQLLIVVPRDYEEPTKEDRFRYMEGKIAEWRTPDDIILVTKIPHAATVKTKKQILREQCKEYKLPL